MSQHFEVDQDFIPAVSGSVGITKCKSKNSGMTVYFADVDSPVINGYFCLGSDQPEAAGIEQLIHHLDSSGGLLPRAMRGDMLRPAWQFHGAENPLADRDQSCYVCCSLGESAFLGTFSCATYLLQNIEAVMELHGYPYKPIAAKPIKEGAEGEKTPDAQGDTVAIEGAVAIEGGAVGGVGVGEGADGLEVPESDEDEDYQGPKLDEVEYLALSEAGEGAMAWESTLQSMFPDTPAFWNRLLNDGRFNRLSSKMRRTYDRMYRPDNLLVIVTGNLKNREHVLDVLHDHEADFFEGRQGLPPFVKPWSQAIPRVSEPSENTTNFVPRNPLRQPMPTVCIGWRGCPSTNVETAMALKVLSAHLAVGPLWTKLVTSGISHRISWCQLDYIDCCALVTVHGIKDIGTAEEITQVVSETIDELLSNSGLQIEEIRAMADRVGWHYIREFESEPFLMVASAIAKAERYGSGSKEQVEMRLRPRLVFDSLVEKPIGYWLDTMKTYFKDQPMFCTKVLPKKLAVERPQQSLKEEPSGDFAASSRRAASRPRRQTSCVAQEANVSVDEDKRSELVLPSTSESNGEKVSNLGLLEEHLQTNPFPFGDFETERKEFESRLDVTKDFLENVTTSEFKSWPLKSFNPESPEQHPSFPLNDLPLYTFLEDTETSFVYITTVLDTTHLDENMRKLLPSVTAALGAFVCPRPPGLDTDCEIANPCEFNPPMDIADSQVSIGLNGEMMQCIFLTVIVRPEKYAWAVGLLHYVLNKADFPENFLKFVANEAARGLSANYKMQTAEKPNYDCFDSTELNLHSLIKQIYKEESNARLFVGRRRLDLMMDYIASLKDQPETVTALTNAAWRSIVKDGKIVVQIAGKVEEMKAASGDLTAPWKTYFGAQKQPLAFSNVRPSLETDAMKFSTGTGIALSVNQPRLPCLNIAITINPHSEDFPKLCMAAQLYSMAHKWIWSCWELDDYCSPILRMPCSYANLMTLNLESYDVMGCMKIMEKVMKDDWEWINIMLIVTKLMVVNDPATMELGAQGTIASALLSHLAGQPTSVRRDLLKDSMGVTAEDIQEVTRKYLVKFFDPKQSCCSLLTSDAEERVRLIQRLEELGFKMENVELRDLCVNL